METNVIANGIGAWRNLDDMEDALVLDELLLLTESISRRKHEDFKMAAAIQGIEIDEFEGSENTHKSDDQMLPPEVLAAEKAWKEKKEAYLESGGSGVNEYEGFGLGYSKSK